jgi:hypothetical protein
VHTVSKTLFPIPRGGHARDEMHFKEVAAALHLSCSYYPIWKEDLTWLYLCFPDRSKWLDWHTPEQFDLLVDYLIRACDGNNYTTIGDSFVVLADLRGSPSTLERKRLYIEATLRVARRSMIVHSTMFRFSTGKGMCATSGCFPLFPKSRLGIVTLLGMAIFAAVW